ncbi:MAG: Asp-tRNA(Asn)/Glu-tRNA(Gln) amidotransferase subunit GatC [Promethearchaeota archaeon]
MARTKLTVEDTEHVADLAKISLSEEEKAVFTRQLNDILSYFEKLNELDTSDVPPTYHVLDLKNVFRPDEVKPSLPVEDALKNAPKTQDKFFKAPRIN